MDEKSDSTKEKESEYQYSDIDTILYDVWVLSQSTIFEEIEKNRNTSSKAIQLCKFLANRVLTTFGPPFRLSWGISLRGTIPFSFQELMNSYPKYQIILSPNGSSLATIQFDRVIIRVLADNFKSIHGYFELPHDTLNSWRKAVWNSSGTTLAITSFLKNIHILDLSGRQITTITSKQIGVVEGIAAIVMKERVEKDTFEILVLDFNRTLQRIVVLLQEGKHQILKLATYVNDSVKKTTLSLSQFHQYTLCMDYHSQRRLLVIAGGIDSTPSNPLANPLSIWKIFDESPYFELVHPNSNENERYQSFGFVRSLRNLSHIRDQSSQRAIIHKVKFSPNGTLLATVDLSGTVTVWDVDKFLRIKRWNSTSLYNILRGDILSDLTPEEMIVRDVVWWNDNALVLMCVGGWVAVCGPLLSEHCEIRNLFGRTPEKFLPYTQLSTTHLGKFFLLECEKTLVKVPVETALISDDNDDNEVIVNNNETHSDSVNNKNSNNLRNDEEVKSDLIREIETEENSQEITEVESKASIKMTETEKPRHSKRNVLRRVWNYVLGEDEEEEIQWSPHLTKQQVTWRLLVLSQTTPEKLFLAKIEAEEYGDALSLAKIYGLNTDPVYQKRWCSEPVSHETIQDFLTKVKDKKWVLKEIKERIPSTIKATRLLLEYGLKITTPLWKKPYEVEMDSELKSQETTNLEDHITLTNDEIDLLLYRLLFLRYLDRLDTFAEILSQTHEAFVPKDFLRFRSCNLVNQAIQFAYEEKFSAIDILFTYHSSQLLPYRLPILHHIPETVDPQLYEGLLPDFDSQRNCEGEWDRRRWRPPDWVEHPNILKQLGLSESTAELEDILKVFEKRFRNQQIHPSQIRDQKKKSLSFLPFEDHPTSHKEVDKDIVNEIISRSRRDIYSVQFEQIPEIKFEVEFPSDIPIVHPHSSENLTKWYLTKAKLIESQSGLVDYALKFIELGIKNGIKGLDKIHDALSTLYLIVYECGKDLTLIEFEKFTEYECVSLLLEDSTIDTIISDFHTRVKVLLKNRPNKSQNIELVHRWMVEKAKSGRLDICAKIIQHSKPGISPQQRIIEDDVSLVKIVLDCVYSCPETGETIWRLMNSMFECLPDRDPNSSMEMQLLQDRVDEFEKHLFACELLQKYDLEKPIRTFLDTWVANNLDAVNSLLTKISHHGLRRRPPPTENEWREIVRDMLNLVEKVFPFVSKEQCYSHISKALLKGGNFKLAREYLEMIDSKEAERILLNVGGEYFNSSTDASDPSLVAARECLTLISPLTPERKKELQLIEAVQSLNQLGLNVLPIKVRLESERIKFIQTLLQQNPKSYCEEKTILETGQLLGLKERHEQYQIQLLIAEAAFQCRDWETASRICQELVIVRYHPVWKLCKKLAVKEEFEDLSARMTLISFAMCYCSENDVEELLAYWRSLESRLRCQQLKISLDSSETILTKKDSPKSPTESRQQSKDKTVVLEVSEDDNEEVLDLKKRSLQITHVCLQKTLWEHDNSPLFKNMTFSTKFPPQFRFHDFYRHPGESPSQPSVYDDYRLQLSDPNDIFIAVKHLLFRLSVLTQSISKSRTETLVHLAHMMLSRDLCLCFAYLLSIEKIDVVQKFWDVFISQCNDNPNDSEICIKLASYIFALEIMKFNDSKLQLGTKIYKYSPNAVIDVVGRQLLSLEGKDQNPNLRERVMIFTSYQQRLRDIIKVKELKSLETEVDIARFSNDEEYRSNIILNLARSVKRVEHLQTAINLANRYQSPDPYDLILEHLLALLQCKSDESVINFNLHGYFARLYSKPDLFLQRLDSIIEKIPGTSLPQLQYVYQLQRDCYRIKQGKNDTLFRKEIENLEKRIQLLESFKKIVPPPNFKLILEGSNSALRSLTECLNEQNVSIIVKQIPHVNQLFPSHDKDKLTSSQLFKEWLISLIFKSNSSLEKLEKRLSICEKYIEKLESSDFMDFVETITIKREAYQLPIKFRISFIGSMINYVKKHSTKGTLSDSTKAKGKKRKKQTNIPDSNMKEALSAQLSHLENISDHLILLQNIDTLLNLDLRSECGEMNISFYLQQFDMAFCNIERINEILEQMICNGVDFHVVQHLIDLFRQEEEWKRGSVQKHDESTSIVLKTMTELITHIIEQVLNLLCDVHDISLNFSSMKEFKEKTHPWPIPRGYENSCQLALYYIEQILLNIDLYSSTKHIGSNIDIDIRKIQQETLIQLRSAVTFHPVKRSSHDISPAAKICILKLLMQHSGIYKSLGETEQNALIEHDKKLLETLSSEFIVSQVFSYEIKYEELVSIDSKQKLFVELLDRVTSSSNVHSLLEYLASLLNTWSQNLDESSKQNLSLCWFGFMKKLIEYQHFEFITRLLSENQASQYLSSDDGMKLISLFESTDLKKELYRFGLLFTSHKEVVNAVIQRMKNAHSPLISKANLVAPFSHQLFALQNSDSVMNNINLPIYSRDYDISLLIIILKSNLLVEFISTPFYILLIDLIQYCNGLTPNTFSNAPESVKSQMQKELETIDKKDYVLSLSYTVATLVQNFYFLHAAHLVLLEKNIDKHFHTVNIGLSLLPQYLEEEIQSLSLETNRAISSEQLPTSYSKVVVTREQCRDMCLQALNLLQKLTK